MDTRDTYSYKFYELLAEIQFFAIEIVLISSAVTVITKYYCAVYNNYIIQII